MILLISLEKNRFDDKLKILNKKVTSNKTKYLLVENDLNELSERVKAISTKGLTKDLINKNSIEFLNRNITKLFCIYTSYKIH